MDKDSLKDRPPKDVIVQSRKFFRPHDRVTLQENLIVLGKPYKGYSRFVATLNLTIEMEGTGLDQRTKAMVPVKYKLDATHSFGFQAQNLADAFAEYDDRLKEEMEIGHRNAVAQFKYEQEQEQQKQMAAAAKQMGRPDGSPILVPGGGR